MSRALAVSVLAVIAEIGCATVSSTGFERGNYIETRRVREDVTDVHTVELLKPRAARVHVDRKTCVVSSAEYERLEKLETRRPNSGNLVAMTFLGVVGAGMIVGGQFLPLPALRIVTALAGAGVIAGTTVASVKNVKAKAVVESSTRVAPGRDTEETTSCEESAFTLAEAIPFELTSGETRHTGTTDSTGQLALLPELRRLVDNMLALPAKRLFAERSIPVTLKLGKADPIEQRIHIDEIEPAQWKAWADVMKDATMFGGGGVEGVRWDACTSVLSAPRDQLECALVDQVYTRRITVYRGRFAKDTSGAFGAIHELSGTEGEELTLRLFTYTKGAFVQIMDLETGAVLAEKFSRGLRHDLVVVLPRSSDYMIVLNAEGPDTYEAAVTRTAKDAR